MTLGFIILRHVNSEETNKYWIECYDCIRKHYPLNKILIIDDFSNYTFINTNKILENTLIIHSEFKGRAELLPYYYYYHNKLFDRAVILQDSVFIQQPINFGEENTFIWSFEHHWDYLYNHNTLIELLDKKELISNYLNNSHSHLWKGCFGVMSVIKQDLLCDIQKTFNFFNIISCVTSREERMKLERVFAICFTLCNNYHCKETKSIFGDIHAFYFNSGGYGSERYQTYIGKKNNNSITLPIIKIWSDR